ncbi:hypothetical protein HPB52_014514 [Rhipicephalus sanguineus]|uniref:Uncharacterized protein n=1 Tax=Rhipicephalus sanguineus TaxID=34632 RepID=A0A9D4PGT2_RHISA|nr:hypothetical protein HPB52_014514 [Rhipicephalus sanguineus]
MFKEANLAAFNRQLSGEGKAWKQDRNMPSILSTSQEVSLVGPGINQHRFNVEASGGGRNHRNFNVGGSVHGEYDLYRSRGGTRVVASGGVAHGVTRIDGKTYKGRPQGSVGIGFEIPIGKGR